MAESYSGARWLLGLRGIIAILFGILTILSPVTVVVFFGAYILVDGIFNIIHAFQSRSTNQRWWVLLLEGIIGIAAGILTYLNPVGTVLAILVLIAAWAILTGIMEVIAAIELRKQITNEFWLGLSGVLSIIFGILVLLFPQLGATIITYMIAGYAIAFGVIMIVLALRLGNVPTSTLPPAGARS
jgi:uncharacterized membrane protein HdeD (DUF308 family)